MLRPRHRAPFSCGSGSPADVAAWARSLGLGRCCSSPGLGSGRDPSTFAARQAVLPARPGPGSARSRRPVRCGVPAEPSPILPLPGFTSTSLGARRLPQRSALPSAEEGLRGLGMGKAHGAMSCPRTLPAPLPGLGTGGEAGSSWHRGISAALIYFFLDCMEPRGDFLLQPRSSTCQPRRARL